MKHFSPLLIALAACFAGGCIIVDDNPIYDTCIGVADCDINADRCLGITADWPEGTASNSICTYSCFDDFDCPTSSAGVGGICDSLRMGGDTVCYEGCFDSGDCGFGFDCGVIPSGASVCLPR